MAQNSDGQERTEQPTPKREREAREKGQIARSRELNTVMALLAAGGAFLTLGGGIVESLAQMMRQRFTIAREDIFDDAALVNHFMSTLRDEVWVLLPFMLIMAVVAVLSSISLGGWSLSASALAFKPEKLNPLKGLSRVFGWRGVLEMLKGLAKFLLVLVTALVLLNVLGDRFLGLGGEPLLQGMAHAGELLTWSLLLLSSVLILVAAIDVPFQLWDHSRQLKMTMQEVKDEHKQTEGSPEVKGRQRQLQMEMAQRRMMEEVPKADVVVTNPTHYAVALRYDAQRMGAPVVVAKGAGLVAARIRAVAGEHDVPVLAAPPLARALYFSTELGAAIPEGLYRAVAQVLAYVYQLKQGPIYNREGQAPMSDLPIPDELQHD
ncbi:MAG: flagellar biosynthesis protein FlhB [Gammaproteobacteria bacterium]|nr:flagellar biosynthesis protein FlhB [Gammaproteobacteria bacterium]